MLKTTSQLELLQSVADGIAALFFPNVEVVIHDVSTNKIAYLANNLSKRKPGDDAGLEDFDIDSDGQVTGPYEKLNWDGKKMRSVSIAARDEQGLPRYLLCINLSHALGQRLDNLAHTAPIPFRRQNAGEYEIPALILKPDIAPERVGFSAHIK